MGTLMRVNRVLQITPKLQLLTGLVTGKLKNMVAPSNPDNGNITIITVAILNDALPF